MKVEEASLSQYLEASSHAPTLGKDLTAQVSRALIQDNQSSIADDHTVTWPLKAKLLILFAATSVSWGLAFMIFRYIF